MKYLHKLVCVYVCLCLNKCVYIQTKSQLLMLILESIYLGQKCYLAWNSLIGLSR